MLTSRPEVTSVDRIYLDANGSSPALPFAKEKIVQNLHLIGNPSSPHEHGRVMRALLDEARAHVALAVNALAKEIIFTSGATEANRLFVDALDARAKKLLRPLKILMSPYEHPSLYKPILASAHETTIIPVNGDGELTVPYELSRYVDVLMVTHAHNETGIVNDVDGIAKKFAPDVLVMSDISQAFSRLKPLSSRIDVMSFSAQKMGGLAGAGGLMLRGNAKKLEAPWLGGGQERGFRPGTESSLLLSAFGEAARHVELSRANNGALKTLRDFLEEELAKIATLKIIGKNLIRLPNTSAISFYTMDADSLRIACDLAGISVGFGAACSGLAPEGSFALKRLGLSEQEERATVRFSLPTECSRDQIEETVKRLSLLSHKSHA